MKTKNFLLISFTIIVGGNLFSQSGQKWSVNGNAATSGDFIGTNNNEPLVLKSNNNIGLKVKPNGELMFKSLDLNVSAPSGLVLTSGQGVISRLDFNLNTDQFLSGNGTWQNLPKGNWLNTGNDVYWTAGNVGIGIAPSPIFKLDVVGDARISNNLYVGGGIIITDKVQAATQIKGWDFKVDNDLNVEGSSKFNGTVQLAGLAGTGNRSLMVGPSGVIGIGPPILPLSSANSCFLNAPQWSLGGDNILGLTGYGNNDIGTCDASDFILKSNGTQRLWIKQDGKIGINYSSPFAALSIIAPDLNTKLLSLNSSYGGILVDEKNNLSITTSVNNVGNTFKITHYDEDYGDLETFRVDYQGNTKISSINTTVANPALTITGIDLTSDYQDRLGTTFKIYGNQNGDVSSSRDMSLYYRGSNGGHFYIYDGIPTDGGLNNIGANANLKFSINGSLTNMSSAVEIGNPNAFGNTGSNSALKINADVNSKAITVFSKTGNTIVSNASFIVYPDGKTEINTSNLDAIVIRDAGNTTSDNLNFKVKKNGFVYAREINVKTGTFPDYVFKNDYELMSLEEVEKYIETNDHLKGFEKGTYYEENGMDLGEIVRVQQEKIEELTLYMIELKKEVEKLKNR